jgi:hypothetical protein
MASIQLSDEDKKAFLAKIKEQFEVLGISFVAGEIVDVQLNDKQADNTQWAEITANLTLTFRDKKHPPGGVA